MKCRDNIKVCVIGVGFVGEHLLNNFRRKYNVRGVDLSQERVEMLRASYTDVVFQSNYFGIEDCDVFLVSVPTLVKDNNEVDTSCLQFACDTLYDIVKPGSLVMVESSVYIGATRQLFSKFLTKGVRVGFSPERVDPGRVEPPMEDIPKVISGLDEESLSACYDVYREVFQTVVRVSSCECAEMCKLYENCFRMVNIAYVNEIADVCDTLGIDVHEMISASSTKPFGFMPFYPGIGVGGHCIPVNPYYLLKSGALPVLNYSTKLMERRPLTKAHELLEKYKNASKILVVGIGFKKGEMLTTNSPGYTLYMELCRLGKHVDVYDPIVRYRYTRNDVKFISDDDFTNDLVKYDLVVITLPYVDMDTFCIQKYIKLGGQVHSFVHLKKMKPRYNNYIT